MNNEDFKNLLNKYCNGNASVEEFSALEKAMLDNEDLRREYLSFMNLDTALRNEAEKATSDESEIKNTVKPIIKMAIALAAAIIILLCVNLSYLLKNNQQIQADASTDEPLQRGIAIVTKSINIDQSNINLSEGSTIEQGRLEFDKGLLQLEIFSGVTLIIEGPAKIDLKDTMSLYFSLGKIRAKVPEQAHGFQINTRDAKVIDLGTEFGIQVGDSGQTNLFVYEGEVELHQNRSSKKSLLSNEGLSWKGEDLKEIPLDDSIISFQNMEAAHISSSSKKLEQWNSYAKSIKSRDDLVLFYSFDSENKWSRSLKNESLKTKNSMNGAIVGCQWTQGRWPGKGALEFKNISDRVRVNIPGEYKNMTFSCWVRVEGFDRWLSSLLLTDFYKEGDLHWQLSNEGEIILGAQKNGNTFSPKVIKPEDLGRWIHVATVYNAEKKEIVHFLNGKVVIRDQIEKLQTITLGNSEIGNWHCNPHTGHAIRSLNGRLDEFIIFSSPLSDKEIQDIYQQGTP
ncbi:MAG: FecR domain-containing protein [Lentisphaeraceae bacterium]|nr:FecR domain-containing protein [Lentisphaeraceae bacterium]